MPLSHYSCSNCGFWQRYFAAPPACPVCSDVRNDLPADGWNFIAADEFTKREKKGALECVWREIDRGIWMFSNNESIGIGSSGYLIERETGNIAFESPGWWTQKAIEKLDALGGVKFISASHPHGFGAIHQLENYFPDAAVAFQREAVQFTKALAVNLVFDDVLAIDEATTLYHVGGHYEGQSVLYYEPAKMLFCGDALKFEFDESGTTVGLSCHKAFHKQIPLSKREIENYLNIIGSLDFRQACTPFEHASDVSTAMTRELYETQLANHRTTAAPLFLRQLSENE